MKKIITLLLALVMAASLLAGCASGGAAATPAETTAAPAPAETTAAETTAAETTTEAETSATKIFTDSLGREVEVPTHITKVAVSGPLAQIVLFAICPDELVGIANEWDEVAQGFFDEKYYNLPVLGQLYGGKGELNLETLLASGAEVVIDVGEPKGSAKEDLDALQEQTGIPFIHVTAMLSTFPDAYRMLGDLLDKQDEAEKIAAYLEKTYANIQKISEGADKVNLLYITGDEGHNVIAQGSYHAEIIDLLSNNLAVVDEPSSKGTGNEVDMEQIFNWNPDYIIFDPSSIYSEIGDDATWQQVKAIQDGNYFEAPQGPYNWMGFPPSVQRYLGMMWMAKLLYPDAADFDLYAEVSEYFELFYHCSLSQEKFDELVKNSIGK
ncbi:MAG: ABC transporter substrate-binding protein [Lachnospiraceae bacterium]|nr:ABC transporter substrate-binding protein [Lachnospiraceae bacterium]